MSTFVAPRPSEEVRVAVERLQNAAAKAETALGIADNLPSLTWGRQGKIKAARKAYDEALEDLTEARAELAESIAFEEMMASATQNAASVATEDTISAAESLIPNFATIRDAAAKAGVAEFKDGRQLVRTGTVKMEDGTLAVERARQLGSRVKIK